MEEPAFEHTEEAPVKNALKTDESSALEKRTDDGEKKAEGGWGRGYKLLAVLAGLVIVHEVVRNRKKLFG